MADKSRNSNCQRNPREEIEMTIDIDALETAAKVPRDCRVVGHYDEGDDVIEWREDRY